MISTVLRESGSMPAFVLVLSPLILVNGSPIESSVTKRGLRQGDPLAPFHFLIAAEDLSELVSTTCWNGKI